MSTNSYLPNNINCNNGKSENISCDFRKEGSKFELLTHQNVVRDYLNLYSPYRGLLIYHGLGSGKTCTSIAIAEGMKSDRPIYVLTPASLSMNYMSELKKCGDPLYKMHIKHQKRLDLLFQKITIGVG